MKLAVWFLVLFAVLACCYWAIGHYVIRTDEGIVLLEKRFLTLADTWVDVRGWTVAEFEAHPRVEQALKAQGYGDIPKVAREREAKANLESTVESAKQLGRELGKAMDDFLKNLDRSLNGGAPPPPTNAAPPTTL
jgi:hypothetical protein